MPRTKKNTRSSSSTSSKRTRSNNSRSSRTNSSMNTENMKYEIANEFGVTLGANASSRANGRVGGEMTKRLVEKAKGKNNTSKNNK